MPDNREQLILAVRSLKEVSGVLHEIGNAQPRQLLNMSPRYVQQLNQAAPRIQIPMVRKAVTNMAQSLAQLNKFALDRKLHRAVQPTIPVSISWDNIPAATAGAQATMKAPYSGQPFRVTEIECLTAVPFRFVEFNIGGIDFAEPSRSRVDYGAGVGAPAAAVRGLDFPTIKSRDKTRVIDANWSPWVNVDFTSDATITLTPYNYGASTASVILTIYARSSPCGVRYKKDQYVQGAARSLARTAIMGATYMDALDVDALDLE